MCTHLHEYHVVATLHHYFRAVEILIRVASVSSTLDEEPHWQFRVLCGVCWSEDVEKQAVLVDLVTQTTAEIAQACGLELIRRLELSGRQRISWRSPAKITQRRSRETNAEPLQDTGRFELNALILGVTQVNYVGDGLAVVGSMSAVAWRPWRML